MVGECLGFRLLVLRYDRLVRLVRFVDRHMMARLTDLGTVRFEIPKLLAQRQHVGAKRGRFAIGILERNLSLVEFAGRRPLLEFRR